MEDLKSTSFSGGDLLVVLLGQLDKWVEDCQLRADSSFEKGHVISKVSLLAEKVAYLNVKSFIKDFVCSGGQVEGVQSHAEREFDILIKERPNDILVPFRDEVVSLCRKFLDSGQSGGSAPYVASVVTQAVKKLMLFEVLTPLMGGDVEWVAVGRDENGFDIFQNNRDSRVFKRGKDGRPYFTEAIVFDDGSCRLFSGSVKFKDETIGSFQYIKSFPFVPKTFYVDVYDIRSSGDGFLDENGDSWVHLVKDESQLRGVFEYYDKMEV